MLGTLRYNFLQDALDFVGVHQDRMFQCLESVRVNLRTACLLEAEETCRFLHQMAHYRREWRLHLPDVLNKLMVSNSGLLVNEISENTEINKYILSVVCKLQSLILLNVWKVVLLLAHKAVDSI